MGFVVLAALLMAPQEVQIQTLAGSSLQGHLIQLTEEAVIVASEAGEQSLAVEQVQRISVADAQPSAAAPAAWITLVDESVLAASSYTVTGAEAEVGTLGGGALKISTRLIDHVRFREHVGSAATQWAEIAASERSGDLLVVRKNEVLDFLTGVIHDVAHDVVQFELDGETLRVKRTKVDGIFYHAQKPPKLTPARGVLTDAAGSRLQIANWKLDGDTLQLRTAAGLELTRQISDVSRIDFAQGNLQYLGDLKPESLQWTPFFGDAATTPAAVRGFFQPRMDRSLDGGPLRLAGREFAKGIAAHSRTELTYRLPDKFRSFQALVGIDDRVRPGGHVHLVILGDDRVLFEGMITGKDEPRPLDLDISGMNRLKLIVDFGDHMDVGDALDFCEARVLK